MDETIKAVTVLVALRSILKGDLRSDCFDGDKELSYKFSYSTEFMEDDIIWLQNLPEEKIDNILKDAEELFKKYCPKDWEDFMIKEVT